MTRPRRSKPKLALAESDKGIQDRQAAPLIPINYYLKFQLRGIKKPLVYIVGKEDWDRVARLFYEAEPPLPFFVGFDDVDGKTAIHVRPHFVLLFQALFDGGQLERKRSRNDLDRVIFYVDGISEPLDYDYVDEDEVGKLNELLGYFHDGLSEFISFVDKDGEQNSIRAESIMVIESPNYDPPLEEI